MDPDILYQQPEQKLQTAEGNVIKRMIKGKFCDFCDVHVCTIDF